MIRDDWLMRQIDQFAAGLAAAIAGETVAEAQLDVEQARLALEMTGRHPGRLGE